MHDIVTISLENEMDLVLAHKRTMKVAEKLGLTIATQTTFATAVSEIARTIIEHTDHGSLSIGLEQSTQRYGLKASFTFESEVRFTNADEGYYYAQKLVPQFDVHETDGKTVIEMKIGLPRSLNLDREKVRLLQNYFQNTEPLNAYEEIKMRNDSLNRIAEEQEAELKQSRLIDEKKTEFMSIASHEIKTPITIIKAYSQMAMKAKSQCSDHVQTILGKIDAQSSKLISLVQQLLDVSKMENGQLLYSMEINSFSPFIEQVVGIMKNIIPHHIITLDLAGQGTVNFDALRMEQVICNLLVNAAKYSQKDTTIHISTELLPDNQLKVSVKDEGIGMSPQSMQYVFDKFYRDKDVLRTHTGLGMGLFVVSKIISDHGGKLWAESDQGKGSTFSFSLPVNGL